MEFVWVFFSFVFPELILLVLRLLLVNLCQHELNICLQVFAVHFALLFTFFFFMANKV